MPLDVAEIALLNKVSVGFTYETLSMWKFDV
jgi:hypothetical protein